jgi:CDP-diacylglycerol--serine O-phosphatidyltransferase
MSSFNRRILIPNAVTAVNMAAGFVALILASQHVIHGAIGVLFFAGICDVLDGKLARMLNATSSFGVQFDSFSDVISFGVAPAFIVYQAALAKLGVAGAAVAIFYMLCGVFRLARFNIDAQTPGEKPYFYGLPIPYGAGHLGTYVLMREHLGPWLIALLVALTGVAMASRLRLPNFKNKRVPQWLVVLIVNTGAFIAWPRWPTFLWWNAFNGILLLINWRAIREDEKEAVRLAA